MISMKSKTIVSRSLLLAVIILALVFSCGNSAPNNEVAMGGAEETASQQEQGRNGNGDGSGGSGQEAAPGSGGGGSNGDAQVAQRSPESDAGRARALSFQDTFHEVANQVLPVVVEINVVQTVSVQGPQSPFDFFFGPRGDNRREFQRRGLGSGVIVRQSGDTVYVVTNAHVVGEADQITVVLSDDREFEGEIVGSDDRLDLALVKFTTDEQVPVATFAESGELRVGDWVVAVGNPLGFESTVTAGIVSALGRRPEQGELASSPTDYIQTDAAINPGNSGGALANLNGEIVGINTWIASRSGGNVGLGFAIPANVARKAVDDFIEEGRIVYGWLGVTIDDANPNTYPEIRSDLGIAGRSGALILNVYEGSPADRGGIQPGDYVVSMNGEEVNGASDLSRRVGTLSPNQTVDFGVIRYGAEEQVSVDIAARPTEEQLQQRAPAQWPGLAVVNLTDALRDRLGIPVRVEGVMVAQVQQGSAAAEADLEQGDIVTRIGNTRVSSMRDFYRGLNETANRQRTVRINRGGNTLRIDLRK
jgi:serine protease Do